MEKDNFNKSYLDLYRGALNYMYHTLDHTKQFNKYDPLKLQQQLANNVYETVYEHYELMNEYKQETEQFKRDKVSELKDSIEKVVEKLLKNKDFGEL